MGIKVTLQPNKSFALESDNDSEEDTVTAGLFLMAMSTNAEEKREIGEKFASVATKMDDATFKKCQTAAQDMVLKVHDLREPDKKAPHAPPAA